MENKKVSVGIWRGVLPETMNDCNKSYLENVYTRSDLILEKEVRHILTNLYKYTQVEIWRPSVF